MNTCYCIERACRYIFETPEQIRRWHIDYKYCSNKKPYGFDWLKKSKLKKFFKCQTFYKLPESELELTQKFVSGSSIQSSAPAPAYNGGSCSSQQSSAPSPAYNEGSTSSQQRSAPAPDNNNRLKPRPQRSAPAPDNNDRLQLQTTMIVPSSSQQRWAPAPSNNVGSGFTTLMCRISTGKP